MAKTFEEYQAEYARVPFPFPMPGGASVLIAQPDLTKERAAVAAATASGSLPDGLIAGLRIYVADDDGTDAEGNGDKIAEAWGKLPGTAFQAAVNDMREHFGTKNS